MGLDMYLERRIYIGANYEHRKVSGIISIIINGKPIDISLHKVTYITEHCGYWRKANAIHKWFVDNVQGGADDCREYRLDEDKAQELLKICNSIIANNSRADELLPTQQGFFFGSTDYDEYYFSDIEATKEIMEDVVANPNHEYYYQSSW